MKKILLVALALCLSYGFAYSCLFNHSINLTTKMQNFETDSFTTKNGKSLKITFFRHASLLLEYAGQKIFVDPVSDYADYTQQPKADFILITHEHGDHFDTKAIAAIETSGTRIIANPNCRKMLNRGQEMKNSDVLQLADDMKLEALKDTNYIKTIVTLEDKMDLERKSKQSVQGNLYVRFLCFGNGSLSALHDRSYGFYRRQMILTVKDVPPDRVDDPYLIEKLQRETDDIFLWCLEGLKRLLKNNYRFTISERAKKNLHEAMESGNNIIAFMQSSGYIRLEENTTATSKNLYQAYCRWCEDNTEKPMSAKSFSGYLKENEKKYHIHYSTNIPSDNGKNARGFQGIHTQIRIGNYR